jgi:hypothetical protein
MPIRKIPSSDSWYYLLVFDENGKERREPDGTLMSEKVRQYVANAAPRVTDVFFMSHGWKGDVPAAIEQYDKWVVTMATLQSDRDASRQQRYGFAPLIVGLHWPSLPWGEESIPAGEGALLSAGDELEVSIDAQVDAYASRIADTHSARAAIRSVLEAARLDPDAMTLSSATRDAYATLFAESGLGSGDASGRPGADQDGFDPAAIIADARAGLGKAVASDTTGLLGFGDELRDAMLMPLRQLSFWKMKDRARQFGETGGHELLIQLQLAAPKARFHLMGHSFGCIVVSATVIGAPHGPPLPHPIDSLFLVQGALSLWSYASKIPYAPSTAGYFHRIVKDGLVRGPIVTTRSTRDTAVGYFYPLGAQLKKQLVLGTEYPAYGGVGAFGIRGVNSFMDMPIQSATFAYNFDGGRVYNLEASRIIRNGSGASGAHSDIAHPEVAHAFWAAVLAGRSDSQSQQQQYRHHKQGGLLGAEAEPPLPDHPSQRQQEQEQQQQQQIQPQMQGDGGYQGPRSEEQAPSATSRKSGEQRWVNADFEDHPPHEPLTMGQWYTLAFDVDIAPRHIAVPLADKQLFPEGADEVVLTVQLDSADFDISDRTRPLRLPRVGKSHNKARFDISPRHNGSATIKATIHKDGNFIQQMELTFNVGAGQYTTVLINSRGRPSSAANVLHARNVGLSISPVAGGYDCLVWGEHSARALLPLQPGFLASAVEAARLELMKVVMHQDATGELVFQTGIDIPEADRDFALKTMARAGALLFEKLFFGHAARDDSKTLGELLRNMTSDRTTRLKLQILAETAPLPWGLLYLGDASAGAKLDWANFIGMRHVIEEIPLQNTSDVYGTAIPSDKPQLAVSVNVNSNIDAQMGDDFVVQQQSFWADARASRKRIRVTSRTTTAEVVNALSDDRTDDQILYFYCHAKSTGLADTGGPDASYLGLTDAHITLGDLALDAPIATKLRGHPLVFINACESAEMSPAFYDGFVPYFMSKGARGVIGTECKTPALFAVAWAKRFFERFLDGQPLGEVFLDLRREFLEEHGNPLGLVYAVHCDGDTQIEPALTVAS